MKFTPVCLPPLRDGENDWFGGYTYITPRRVQRLQLQPSRTFYVLQSRHNSTAFSPPLPSRVASNQEAVYTNVPEVVQDWSARPTSLMVANGEERKFRRGGGGWSDQDKNLTTRTQSQTKCTI